MMKIARETLKKMGLTNVVFRKGTSDHISLPSRSADVVAAITSADADNSKRFVRESEMCLEYMTVTANMSRSELPGSIN